MTSAYIPKRLRRIVAEQSRYRCGYCLSPESILGMAMVIDHLTPQSRGGLTEEKNLWLACAPCNTYKADRVFAADPESRRVVRIYNPRYQAWQDHFTWTDGGILIMGKGTIGRATVESLRLNRKKLVRARQLWIIAGWHPPKGTE